MKIEKGIPMPRSPKATYPFQSMEIGDSFFVKGQDSQGSAAMNARASGRYHGRKYTCRKEGDGVRIWRIE